MKTSTRWLEVELNRFSCVALQYIAHIDNMNSASQKQTEPSEDSGTSITLSPPSNSIQECVVLVPKELPLDSYQNLIGNASHYVDFLKNLLEPIPYQTLGHFKFLFTTTGFTTIYPLLNTRSISSKTRTIVPLALAHEGFPERIEFPVATPFTLDSVATLESCRYLAHFATPPLIVSSRPITHEELVAASSDPPRVAEHLLKTTRNLDGLEILLALHVALHKRCSVHKKPYRLVDEGTHLHLQRNDTMPSDERKYFPKLEVVSVTSDERHRCLEAVMRDWFPY